MGRQLAPVHYLRPNHAEWSPPAVVFWDTETRVLPGVEPETLALRCWDAHFVDRRTRGTVKPRDEWGQGDTAAQLVDWLERVTRNREAVWCFAHNLSFDLVTTRLPLIMAARGWTVTDMAIGGRAPWMRLARGKRRVVFVDSWSWLPRSVEEIGVQLGLAKPQLPAEADELATWHHRCRADVTIIETGILDLMDWWDRNRLGRWTISGAACGWNAYRHTPTAIKVVIDPDPKAVAADRLAVHGGRRGTWVVGDHRAGPFHELDLVAAYPTVAAHLPLPIGRTRTFDQLPTDTDLVGGERWGITARVKVRTDVARWPVRIGRHTWYPVGEFWADLAGPDIAEARRLGCLLAIGKGTVHRLGTNMMPWARWCLDVQNGAADDAPIAAQLAAKSWGRSVIGKWASRAYEKTKLGPSPFRDWSYQEGWDHNSDTHGGMVDIAGQRWWVSGSGDPDNAYPAVLAWVEAEVRVRLSRAVEAIGEGAVLQCDTDGLIVAARNIGTAAAHGHLRAPAGASAGARLNWLIDNLDPVLAPLTLRVKRTVDHVHVIGPQHLYVGGQRRFAGLPGTAKETGPGTFTAKTWPKLQWQLAHGSPAGYVRPVTTPTVVGPFPTGWVLADGSVRPLEVRIGVDGTTRAIPWSRSSYAAAGARLGPRQHQQLVEFW